MRIDEFEWLTGGGGWVKPLALGANDLCERLVDKNEVWSARQR